ncbi:MAG: hypothetical protein AAGF12_03255 [Myxococcota bacterium]
MRRCAWWVLVLGWIVAPSPVAADGLYQRFDGDVMLSAAVGGGVRVDGEPDPVASLELRARYLDTAGFVVAADYFGDLALTFAVDLRPLFLPLFFTNQSTGSEFVDLLLQSIGIEIGASFLPIGTDGGVGLAIGAGIDVPVVLPSSFANGIFARLAVRHVRAAGSDPGGPQADVSAWSFMLLISVQGIVDLGLASREVARFRPD